MASIGWLWFGEDELEKLDVLIGELAKLYKVDKEIIQKGVDVIEEEVKKIHLQKQD